MMICTALLAVVAALDTKTDSAAASLQGDPTATGMRDESKMSAVQQGQASLVQQQQTKQLQQQQQQPVPTYGGSKALEDTLHISPAEADREACITRIANQHGRRKINQATDGTANSLDKGCYEAASTKTDCELLYEKKQRDPSVVPAHQAPHIDYLGGFDLLGEIAICHWSDIKGCIAGQHFICPDDDIVVTENEGARSDGAARGEPDDGAPQPPAPRRPESSNTVVGAGPFDYSYKGANWAPGMRQGPDGEWHDRRAEYTGPDNGRRAGHDATPGEAAAAAAARGALIEKSAQPGAMDSGPADRTVQSSIVRPDLSARVTCQEGKVDTSSGPRAPLGVGLKCFDKSEADCPGFFEVKERSDHNHLSGSIGSAEQDVGHSLHGEGHLCEWSFASGCATGTYFICAEDDIIVTTAEGERRPVNGGPVHPGSHPSGYPAASPPETVAQSIYMPANEVTVGGGDNLLPTQ